MKKRTSSMSRRIVSLLMSMVLTLTLVTPAAVLCCPKSKSCAPPTTL